MTFDDQDIGDDLFQYITIALYHLMLVIGVVSFQRSMVVPILGNDIYTNIQITGYTKHHPQPSSE